MQFVGQSLKILQMSQVGQLDFAGWLNFFFNYELRNMNAQKIMCLIQQEPVNYCVLVVPHAPLSPQSFTVFKPIQVRAPKTDNRALHGTFDTTLTCHVFLPGFL